MSIENEDFKSWFEEMKSNPLWWMRMQELYCRKNLNKIAASVHLYLLASPERLKSSDYADFRRLFQTFASRSEDELVRPQLQQVEEKKAESQEEWKPASDEHVAKCVAEFDKMLAEAPMMVSQRVPVYARYNVSPAVKMEPHPITTVEQAYQKERHIEYLKKNYDAKTGKKLPTWIPEREFNKLYDEGLT